jgi:hypothetical protein
LSSGKRPKRQSSSDTSYPKIGEGAFETVYSVDHCFISPTPGSQIIELEKARGINVNDMIPNAHAAMISRAMPKASGAFADIASTVDQLSGRPISWRF